MQNTKTKEHRKKQIEEEIKVHKADMSKADVDETKKVELVLDEIELLKRVSLKEWYRNLPALVEILVQNLSKLDD